jgi:hypothetical protein
VAFTLGKTLTLMRENMGLKRQLAEVCLSTRVCLLLLSPPPPPFFIDARGVGRGSCACCCRGQAESEEEGLRASVKRLREDTVRTRALLGLWTSVSDAAAPHLLQCRYMYGINKIK